MPRKPLAVAETEPEYGPAMQALPYPRWRAFVVALCEQPKVNYTQAAMAADPEGWGKNPTSAAQQGMRLAHDERVQAALREEGQRRLGSLVGLATGALRLFIEDPTATKTERMAAIKMVLNRVGMPETTEHKVSVTRVQTEAEKLAEVLQLAEFMGLDPAQLLGKYGVPIPERLNAPPVSAMADQALPLALPFAVEDAEFTEDFIAS